MTVIAKRAVVIVTMFAAVTGGFLFDRYPIFGIILIAAGLVGSICVYWNSESSQDADEQLLRATAQLMFASGAGSVYTKLIREKIRKPGGHKTAKRDLEKALKAIPNDPDALFLYGASEALRYSFRALVSPNGRQDDAHRQRIQSVIERGLNTGLYVPQFYCIQGILLDVPGDWEGARRCFSKANDIEPSWRWRLFKCTSYGMECNYPAALYEMERALEEGASGYLVDYYYGRCLAAAGEFNRAVHLFQRVRRQRGLFYQLAVSLQEAYYFEWRPFMSAYYEARASLMLLRSAPRMAFSHAQKAAWHCISPSILATAKAISKISLRIPFLRKSRLTSLHSPDEPYASLAMCMVKTIRYAAAKLLLLRAVQQPARPETWWNLCTSAILTEDWPEAERAIWHLKRVCSGNPTIQEYEEIIRQRCLPSGLRVDEGLS